MSLEKSNDEKKSKTFGCLTHSVSIRTIRELELPMSATEIILNELPLIEGLFVLACARAKAAGLPCGRHDKEIEREVADIILRGEGAKLRAQMH